MGGQNLGAGLAVEVWAQRYNGFANGDDDARAVAVGIDGEVYVTGSSLGAAGLAECLTIAYSASGVPVWTNRYSNGEGNALGKAIAVDVQSGNVYVAGDCSTSPLETDLATVAYSGEGVPLWTNRYNRPGECCAFSVGVGVSSNGTVHVAGNVGGMAPDYVVLAYSSVGKPLWTNWYVGIVPHGTDALQAMALDSGGNLYASGFSDGTNGFEEFATVSYSSEGLPLWTNRFSAVGNCIVAGVAVDDARRRVYVTGFSGSNRMDFDYVTIAYSALGAAVWTNRYGGPAKGPDVAQDLAVDSSGNVYVTGYSWNENGHYDYATIAYSSEGASLWTNLYSPGSNLDALAFSVRSDGVGCVIVAGACATAQSLRDYATVAYSTNGLPLWTNRYNGSLNGDDYETRPYCLAVGRRREVYVTGSSQAVHDSATNYDFATVKYVPAPDILFSAIERLPNAACRFTITAPVNTPYRLEASAELTNWQTVTNFPPLPVPSIDYTDSLAPGFVQRFYRAVWSP